MSKDTYLKNIEKTTFISYHEDGLVDIGLGFVVLMFGITIFADIFWIGAMAAVLYLPFYTLAKRSITDPRIGYVKFGPHSKSALSIMIFLLLGITFFATGFTFFIWFDIIPSSVFEFIELNFLIILAIIGGLICTFMAFTSKIKRFYLYSVIIFAVFSVSQLLLIPLNFSLIFLGCIILLVGFITLILFIRRYPKIKTNENFGDPDIV